VLNFSSKPLCCLFVPVNELLGGMPGSTPLDSTMSCESEDSDFDELGVSFAFSSGEPKITSAGNVKKSPSMLSKKMSPCITSVSTALDARLENGVESTTEIRLRMMAVVDCEVLSQSLKAPIEVSTSSEYSLVIYLISSLFKLCYFVMSKQVPSEVLKNAAPNKSDPPEANTPQSSSISSCTLLSECFEKMFQMMASEVCYLIRTSNAYRGPFNR
jgi:hypothetical protein